MKLIVMNVHTLLILGACLLGFAHDSYAQTRIGIGLTYDGSVVKSTSPHIAWGTGHFQYFKDSSSQIAPNISLEHFLTDHFSALIEFQWIGKKRFNTGTNGFITTRNSYQYFYQMGGFAVRYHPRKFWFVGVGPVIQFTGRGNIQRYFNLEFPDRKIIDTKIGEKQLGVQFQAGLFYRGLELQLVYSISKVPENQTVEFVFDRYNLLHNQFRPTLRYSLNIGKRTKKRQ